MLVPGREVSGIPPGPMNGSSISACENVKYTCGKVVKAVPKPYSLRVVRL